MKRGPNIKARDRDRIVADLRALAEKHDVAISTIWKLAKIARDEQC